MRFLARFEPLVLLVMRVVLGIIMTAHGFMKVTNIKGVMGMLSHLHIPTWMAYLTAWGEFLGGMLILVGFLTQFAALVIVIDLVVAIVKSDFAHGLTGRGGYELPLAVCTLAFALLFLGPGPVSIDRLAFGGGARTPARGRARS